jgi:AraC-like DNA-binding protein
MADSIEPGAAPRYQDPDQFDRPRARAFEIDVTRVERLLLRTPQVALGQYRCPPNDPQFDGGGPQRCQYIVFPRRAVRIELQDSPEELVAPGTLRFYNIGDRYRRRALDAQPDHSDWIALAPDLLDQWLALFATGRGAGPHLFQGRSAAVPGDLFLAQRRLFDATLEAAPTHALGIEEAALDLAWRSVARAVAHWKGSSARARTPRPGSERRRQQIVERAKEALSLDLEMPLSITQVAAAAHCSAAHLSRLFRHHTGTSLHAFRQRVRLQKALQLLSDGGAPLADVAAQLGFASHSHLTSSFRRYFGDLPSRIQA